MKSIYAILLLLFTQLIYSQAETSIIRGTVIQDSSGKPIPGVIVDIQGSNISTTTDASGNFTLTNIRYGVYELHFTYPSFQIKVISDVVVSKIDTPFLTVSLIENRNNLQEVVVKRVSAKAESVNGLIKLQKNSIRVSDGISAETIKRTPDRTTSDVLKRISGASVQENKFIIIRGLNERYNTSYLNGAPLPSSEPDQKAFSFDIFPANMIDNLVIYKTASPDLPGEFAGGVIDITTKATPDKNFQSLSIGGGYNTVTTNKERIYSAGGKTDWIGIDDGTRSYNALPLSKDFITLQNDNTINGAKLIDLSKSVSKDWSLQKTSFKPNTNFQYTLGRYFKGSGEQSVGFLFSLSHSRTNNFFEGNRLFYEGRNVESNNADKLYSENVLFGGIANVSLKLNANNKFTFKNLYSINSENGVFTRQGFNVINNNFLDINARLFTSNKIYNGQFEGDHFLSKSRIKINWVSSFSTVSRLTPGERRNGYTTKKQEEPTDDNPNPAISLPQASINFKDVGVLNAGSIFSSTNDEDTNSTKIDLSKKVDLHPDFTLDIKTGGFIQSRDRKFDSRFLGYVPFVGILDNKPYNLSSFNQQILNLDDSKIFDNSNIGLLEPGKTKTGLVLKDGTRKSDGYKGNIDLYAAYLMIENNIFNKLKLVWGVRVENFLQKLNSFEDNSKPVSVNNSDTDFLPSINAIYSLNSKQNLRLSYSQTLNRPEFRELASFLFYDVKTGRSKEGNLELKSAKIYNYDFRYEIYPGKGQLFSISAFYKKFYNPIEVQILTNNSDKYQNAKEGENKGMELEYRTLLSSVFGTKKTKILEDITLFTNIAIIRSKVDISNLNSAENLIQTPLQGQSPYVINAGIQYLNNEFGWATALNFNRIGNRIAFQQNQTVGIIQNAIWEKSRSFLDFQLTKSFFNKKFEVKFNAKNILGQDLIFYSKNYEEGNSGDGGLKAIVNSIFTGTRENVDAFDEQKDDLISRTKNGRTYSLSLTYNF